MAIILMAMNNNDNRRSSNNSTDIQSQVYLGETLKVAGKCLNGIGHFHCVCAVWIVGQTTAAPPTAAEKETEAEMPSVSVRDKLDTYAP